MDVHGAIGVELEDQRFVTKAEFTADHLRRLITTGEIQPGERIVMSRISRQLRVSDTPVREAIKQLVSEGLVVETPHIGPTVPSFTLEDIREAFEMRAALSALAVSLNAPYYTKGILEKIDAILAKGQELLNQGDAAGYGDMNLSFHIALVDTGHFPSLQRVYLGLITQTQRFRAGFRLMPWRMQLSHQEHNAIRDALVAGDYARASELSRAHEQTAMLALIEYMESQLEGGNG
jgi:DNA-binding GntR family transcriptional regulator